MLTCIVDANENREVVIVDIPIAFVHTVVKDENDRSMVHWLISWLLVSIAPDVYGPYVTVEVEEKGEK